MKRKPRLGEGSGQDEEEKKEKEKERKGKRKAKGKEKKKTEEKKGKEKEGRGDWCELLSLCIVAGIRAFVTMLYVMPRKAIWREEFEISRAE